MPITWMETTNQMAMATTAAVAVMRIIKVREVKNANKNHNKKKILKMII